MVAEKEVKKEGYIPYPRPKLVPKPVVVKEPLKLPAPVPTPAFGMCRWR